MRVNKIPANVSVHRMIHDTLEKNSVSHVSLSNKSQSYENMIGLVVGGEEGEPRGKSRDGEGERKEEDDDDNDDIDDDNEEQRRPVSSSHPFHPYEDNHGHWQGGKLIGDHNVLHFASCWMGGRRQCSPPGVRQIICYAGKSLIAVGIFS